MSDLSAFTPADFLQALDHQESLVAKRPKLDSTILATVNIFFKRTNLLKEKDPNALSRTMNRYVAVWRYYKNQVTKIYDDLVASCSGLKQQRKALAGPIRNTPEDATKREKAFYDHMRLCPKEWRILKPIRNTQLAQGEPLPNPCVLFLHGNGLLEAFANFALVLPHHVVQLAESPAMVAIPSEPDKHWTAAYHSFNRCRVLFSNQFDKWVKKHTELDAFEQRLQAYHWRISKIDLSREDTTTALAILTRRVQVCFARHSDLPADVEVTGELRHRCEHQDSLAVERHSRTARHHPTGGHAPRRCGHSIQGQ
jgi:hypothetical protein